MADHSVSQSPTPNFYRNATCSDFSFKPHNIADFAANEYFVFQSRSTLNNPNAAATKPDEKSAQGVEEP